MTVAEGIKFIGHSRGKVMAELIQSDMIITEKNELFTLKAGFL